MELKPYQQSVINDLALYLEKVQEKRDARDAFDSFWRQHPRTPLAPALGDAIEPYKNNVARVPHVCVKVPTAGGKTFIACNALKTMFDAFKTDQPKVVVWLVPSITILYQTIKNLKDPAHPYRQKINTHFGNRVEVYDKATLLQGGSFSAASVREQLSIMVFSFDSLRARNKEDRKVFQENGNLQSFQGMLEPGAEITLGAVIKQLNPVVVVDESHNAESNLSVDMLKELNPCMILDLTATPRNNSNIVSFVDAMELKKEHMVKLPVIVYNHHDKTEVINSALQLQKRLELHAKEEEKKGGRYIRPIVLFQAQPRNGKDFANEDEEKSNVQKLKEKLLELKIPEAQIKIKTANINELKGIDLMSRECEVRYIITINALKEGWDCPFAYILASLADKSSAVDVEQILGRVLRQPYVMPHSFPLLNMSFVLTASSRFMETLDNIVKGLNRAGFSERDYKLADSTALPEPKTAEPLQGLLGFGAAAQPVAAGPEDITEDIDLARLMAPAEGAAIHASVAAIEETALMQNEAFEQKVAQMEANNEAVIPNEIKTLVKTYEMKEVFRHEAEGIALPQFYVKVPPKLFDECEEIELEKERLLEGFVLSKGDTNIAFTNIDSQLYRVDLDATKKEHTPTFVRIDGVLKEGVLDYIRDPERKGSRVKNTADIILKLIGSLPPIKEGDLRKYVARVAEDFTDEQFTDFYNQQYSYVSKIKEKIKALSEAYAEKKFREMLDTDKVYTKATYTLPVKITPGDTAKDINKSLYEKEAGMNQFEERVINEIGNMPNVYFWTRNIERKGFRINGFVNHYPDFIIRTKSGKTIVLETKGDHLDAEQKIRLGNLWAQATRGEAKYFMVYDKKEVEGAYKLEDFLSIAREM